MTHLHVFLASDCTKIEARQSNPMDSPPDAPPGLKDAPPMAESWHYHHTHLLVITGTGLAGLSNSNAQSSWIHSPKEKDLYPISKPFKMQTLFQGFASQRLLQT